MIKYRKDTDNIVTLTFDMDQSTVNLMNHSLGNVLLPVLEQLKKEKSESVLAGVIITSAKNSFMAGGDLQYLYDAVDHEVIFQYAQTLQQTLREFELLGVPLVSAINGSALGSGYEFALATHYRIMLNRPDAVIGLPEVNYGLMPGSGGISRMLWRLGLQKATDILLQGKRNTPAQALELKMIDALEEDTEIMMQRARKWIYSHPDVRQEWDRPGGRIAGGTLKTWRNAHFVTRITAEVIAQTHNNDPARKAILASLVEGTAVDFETSNRIAARYFTWLIRNTKSKNMTRAFWFDTNMVRQGRFSPVPVGSHRFRKIGIAGAGRIGSGIARLAAVQGLGVVLKDVTATVAEKARRMAADEIRMMEKAGELNADRAEKAVEAMVATDQSAMFADCDVVIESVFEHAEAKINAARDAEAHMDKHSLLAANTSSITISSMAAHIRHPSRFVGLHFLPPLRTGSIVEVIQGEKTDPAAMGTAFDLVRKLGCLPIFVRDAPGFFVLRVWCQYVLEAILMITEGQMASSVERAGLQAGMQQKPLLYADDLGFEVILNISTRHSDHQPALQAIKTLMDDYGRKGMSAGGGFYEPNADSPRMWKDLAQVFPVGDSVHIQRDVIDRLLYIQVIETLECIDKEIVFSLPEANLGTLIGGGFSPYHGGAVQFVNSTGIEAFRKRAAQLEEFYGCRFRLPANMDALELKLRAYQQQF